MMERDRNCELLYEYLHNILRGQKIQFPDISELEEPFREIGQQAQLLQDAFGQLQEKAVCQEETADKLEHCIGVIESYHRLLQEMTRRRNEWVFIVDAEKREVVYCNKQKTDPLHKCGVPCTKCEIQLPVRNHILEWVDSDQSVWEIKDEDNNYYRINSFPIEWIGRHSYVHIIVDVTKSKNEVRILTNKAYIDPGTGISNRLFFEEHIQKILKDKSDATLCYLDLDGLKYVNDNFGHPEGDQYIHGFVDTIHSSFRSEDVFARIGGDEFIVILMGCYGELAQRKLAAARERFMKEHGQKYPASFSYGVCEIDGVQNQLNEDEIIRLADSRMYEFKRHYKEKRE